MFLNFNGQMLVLRRYELCKADFRTMQAASAISGRLCVQELWRDADMSVTNIYVMKGRSIPAPRPTARVSQIFFTNGN
jgi:hypothetical protein